MSSELRFTIPGPTQPKQRPRFSRGSVITPPETRIYEAKVGRYAKAAIGTNEWSLEGSYSVEFHFFQKDRRPTDIDNLAKSVADGLNKIAYQDDSRILAMFLTKQLDRVSPRCEVVITLIEDNFK